MPCREIEAILRSEVERAKSRARGIAEEFSDIIGSVPSGLAQPDAALRVTQVGARRRMAIEELDRALRRLSDFLLQGTIPDDFHGEP